MLLEEHLTHCVSYAVQAGEDMAEEKIKGASPQSHVSSAPEPPLFP